MLASQSRRNRLSDEASNIARLRHDAERNLITSTAAGQARVDHTRTAASETQHDRRAASTGDGAHRIDSELRSSRHGRALSSHDQHHLLTAYVVSMRYDASHYSRAFSRTVRPRQNRVLVPGPLSASLDGLCRFHVLWCFALRPIFRRCAIVRVSAVTFAEGRPASAPTLRSSSEYGSASLRLTAPLSSGWAVPKAEFYQWCRYRCR